MWEIENATRFVAAGVGVTDQHGRNSWVVVVKATFVMGPRGILEPAPKDRQVGFLHVPLYWGEDGTSSLRYEADACPKKLGTDVVLNGYAWAPGGRAATTVEVRLRIGDRVKALEVSGDRVFERQLSGMVAAGAPRPFIQQPIVYEKAFGGHDRSNPDPTKQRYHAENPVGCGVVKAVGAPAPCIEHAGRTAGRGPAGFGAIASFWHPRARYVGTVDAAWVEHRKPLLPADFDPRFHHCAPVDQQLAPPLRGGEVVELHNLTPDSHYAFLVPKHYFGFTTICRGDAIEHRATLDTLVIEPSEQRVIVSWKTQLDCHRDFDYIDFTRVIEKEYIGERARR